MLKKTAKGWYVYSKDGKKKLGGPYLSRAKAVKRLGEIEYFVQEGESK